MKTNMILSASGWRKVFAISGDEQDRTVLTGEENLAISIFSAKVFSDYIKLLSGKENPVVILGMDARPTGPAICEACIKTFISQNVKVKFAGIIAAPEIMAYSKNSDGFMYISASHNPIGHNGIKFGTNSGGVLDGTENAKLVEKFNELCAGENAVNDAFALIQGIDEKKIAEIYNSQKTVKEESLNSYFNFLNKTISASEDSARQEEFFRILKNAVREKNIGVVCDMNGSARSVSVDRNYFAQIGINFYPFNDKPGKIVHEIIPEAENLVHVASQMEKLQKEGKKDAVLGYMPDCDGDRGNIVYWDEKEGKSVILKAQEVFSFSVLSELLYSDYCGAENNAVAVNCPTSMRIEEIADRLGAKVFRAEVGEANVVNLASEKRKEGFNVRIFGEGSNGGTITYPSAVRDPLNTIFAIIKLLAISDLYKTWCEKSGTSFSKDFTITDILNSLPSYTTTGVSEKRAVLHIETKDHEILKSRFQKIFETQWESKKSELKEKFNIYTFEGVITNGTKETRNVSNWSLSKKGGLKIIFYDEKSEPEAFIWMRGSGTEPVFRIMCDVKGNNPEMEKELLAWETEMLLQADK